MVSWRIGGHRVDGASGRTPNKQLRLSSSGHRRLMGAAVPSNQWMTRANKALGKTTRGSELHRLT